MTSYRGNPEAIRALVQPDRVHRDLYISQELFELEQGDSVDYRSSTPHRVVNTGETRAEVLWIISPPSY